MGDVSPSRLVSLLLFSCRGLVVEAFVRHGGPPSGFDVSVQANVKYVRPALQDENPGPAEDHRASAVGEPSDGKLGVCDIGDDPKLLDRHRDTDEQPAEAEGAVQQAPDGAAALGIVGEGGHQGFVDLLCQTDRDRPIDEPQLQSLGDGGADNAAPRAVGGRDRNCAHRGYLPSSILTGLGSESLYPDAGTSCRTRSAAFDDASAGEPASTELTPIRIFAVPATDSTVRPFWARASRTFGSPGRPGAMKNVLRKPLLALLKVS